ncbi:unnamed protein product [Dibothriocephalus latus]|uniref:Uncharacterized protein n=1 Tax=Dibothriocephalus latus TaxID=60516 RepID=A0A3P6RAQ3_DIBLA|nr:unnamed protein product [Dibothriocephalus latus]
MLLPVMDSSAVVVLPLICHHRQLHFQPTLLTAHTSAVVLISSSISSTSVPTSPPSLVTLRQ